MSVILIIILVVLTIAFVMVTIGLHQKLITKVCRSKKRLDGRTVIVTGGTAGIGIEIATDFAERGAKVIIASPFEDEGTNAEKVIKNISGNDKVFFKFLNLASLKSVREFAVAILNTEERLDILVNNAGVGVPKDILTEDGLNFIMQVNFFGHFLLTILLLPLLKKTGTSSDKSRIVNQSSVLHHFGKVDIEFINATNHWYKIQLYSNSKLCQILFAHELTKRLTESNVVINSVEPGLLVATSIHSSASTMAGAIAKYVMPYIFNTAWEGAQTAIHAALDKYAGEVSGKLFTKCKESEPSNSATNDKLAKILWEESVKLVKLSDSEIEDIN